MQQYLYQTVTNNNKTNSDLGKLDPIHSEW